MPAMQWVRRLVSVAIVCSPLLLSGCVTIPDSIKGTSATPQQNFVAVHNAPDLYVGQESRFGGTVVNVINQKDATMLEIAVMPLDDTARPILNQPSVGRLIAKSATFLDPVDFKGQLVTVVGPLTGSVDGKIGKTPYTFVTMDVQGYQRWHVTQEIVMPPQPFGPWDYGYGAYGRGGFWGPGFGPGWGWYNPGPARVPSGVPEN
ncbi:MAG: Slp family lipoprotein [Hafnia alvei]